VLPVVFFYECETWSFTLRKEGILMFLPHRAKVSIPQFTEEVCAVTAAQPIIFTRCYNGHQKIKKNIMG